jgi:hypothetical protein
MRPSIKPSIIHPKRSVMCKKILAAFPVAAIPVAAMLASGLVMAPSAFGQVRGYLTVRILEGDGAFNDIKHGSATRPVVEIKDEGGNAVSGATVSFTLPTIGPGGLFADGKATCTVTSDAQGVARSDAYKPNSIEGRFNIRVAATYQGKQGTLAVTQTNTLASGPSAQNSSHKKLWIVVAVVAVGAGVGVALALSHGGSSSSSAPTPTVLSSGGITIGAPQ